MQGEEAAPQSAAGVDGPSPAVALGPGPHAAANQLAAGAAAANLLAGGSGGRLSLGAPSNTVHLLAAVSAGLQAGGSAQPSRAPSRMPSRAASMVSLSDLQLRDGSDPELGRPSGGGAVPGVSAGPTSGLAVAALRSSQASPLRGELSRRSLAAALEAAAAAVLPSRRASSKVLAVAVAPASPARTSPEAAAQLLAAAQVGAVGAAPLRPSRLSHSGVPGQGAGSGGLSQGPPAYSGSPLPPRTSHSGLALAAAALRSRTSVSGSLGLDAAEPAQLASPSLGLPPRAVASMASPTLGAGPGLPPRHGSPGRPPRPPAPAPHPPSTLRGGGGAPPPSYGLPGSSGSHAPEKRKSRLSHAGGPEGPTSAPHAAAPASGAIELGPGGPSESPASGASWKRVSWGGKRESGSGASGAVPMAFNPVFTPDETAKG